MNIFSIFQKIKSKISHSVSTQEQTIYQELSGILPLHAKSSVTITSDNICVIIIENCNSSSQDLDFDAIGSKLLKYSSASSLKIDSNGEYIRIVFEINSSTPGERPMTSSPAPAIQADFSAKIQYIGHETPQVTINTSEEEEKYDLEAKYVRLSTAGDDNVCPMCAQFEGKFFLAEDAPQLPLCPVCSCCYEYYFEADLPANTIISSKNDFILPSECTSQFYKHQQKIYEEDDINKQIRICEKDLKLLDAFMAPYLLGGFPAPAELACRDLLPELYMLLGKWDKAKRAINRCIDAHAYSPDDGTHELAYLESYQKVAISALNYITENPGCLQRNIYKKLPYEGMEREQLKHFLRYSQIIQKEKCGSTNKLTIANPKP